jgi:hypothetical protein
VAGRDLEPLEIVILEKPLFCAPADDSGHENSAINYMCLGCFARLAPSTKSLCSKCKWPVCDKSCESVMKLNVRIKFYLS